MKFFEKIMIDEYNEWLNEAYKKPERLSAAQGGPSNQEYMARLYLPKIKKTKDKSGLDRIFKQFEKAVKSLNLDSDDIDLMQSWFDERSKELGIKESYEISEAPIAAKGWDDSSVEKFGKTIGKDPKDKGFFDACVLRMKGKEGFDEQKAKGFCASIKDKAYGDPHWRGKGKTKAQAKKDTSGKEYEKK
jgi:hypothetical protein